MLAVKRNALETSSGILFRMGNKVMQYFFLSPSDFACADVRPDALPVDARPVLEVADWKGAGAEGI